MVLSGQFLFDRDFDSDDPDFERRKREREQQERRERARYLGKSEAEAEVEAQKGNTHSEDLPEGGDGDGEAGDEPAGPPLAYSEEALRQAVEEARQNAYKEGEKAGYKAGRKEGQREGKQDAERSQAKQIQKSLDAIAKKLPALLDEERDALAEVPGTAARIGVAIARTMFPHLAREHGLDEIEAVLRQRLVELIDEPRLVVKVAPEIREDVAERAKQVAQESGFDQRMAVVAETGLGPSDVKLEWSNGGAERIMDRLWRDTEEAVKRTIGDGPTEFLEGQAGPEAATDAATAQAPTLAEDDPQPTPEPEPATEPEPEPAGDDGGKGEAEAGPEAAAATGDTAASQATAPAEDAAKDSGAEGQSQDSGAAQADDDADAAKQTAGEPDVSAGTEEGAAAAGEAASASDAGSAEPAAADAAQEETDEPAPAADTDGQTIGAPGGPAVPEDGAFEQGNILGDDSNTDKPGQQARRPTERREMGAAIRDFDAEEEAVHGNASADEGAGLDQALQEFTTDDDDQT